MITFTLTSPHFEHKWFLEIKARQCNNIIFNNIYHNIHNNTIFINENTLNNLSVLVICIFSSALVNVTTYLDRFQIIVSILANYLNISMILIHLLRNNSFWGLGITIFYGNNMHVKIIKYNDQVISKLFSERRYTV